MTLVVDGSNTSIKEDVCNTVLGEVSHFLAVLINVVSSLGQYSSDVPNAPLFNKLSVGILICTNWVLLYECSFTLRFCLLLRRCNLAITVIFKVSVVAIVTVAVTHL